MQRTVIRQIHNRSDETRWFTQLDNFMSMRKAAPAIISEQKRLSSWKGSLTAVAVIFTEPLVPDHPLSSSTEAPLEDRALVQRAVQSGVKRKRIDSSRAQVRCKALGDHPRE